LGKKKIQQETERTFFLLIHLRSDLWSEYWCQQAETKKTLTVSESKIFLKKHKQK